MFTVELYARIRHVVMVDGLSRREAATRFGVHRNTITKMLQYSIPPGYRRRERPASKKLGPQIDAILEADRSVHKKQRHTAQRIFERLRDERGFSGGYTIVREYVAEATSRSREMFVPLSHRPGHAQADFGEADGYIAGKKVVGGTGFWSYCPLRRQGVGRHPSLDETNPVIAIARHADHGKGLPALGEGALAVTLVQALPRPERVGSRFLSLLQLNQAIMAFYPIGSGATGTVNQTMPATASRSARSRADRCARACGRSV